MQKEGEEEEVAEEAGSGVGGELRGGLTFPQGFFLGADSLCASPQLLCSFLLSAALLLVEWP